jgi:hypothetical protein
MRSATPPPSSIPECIVICIQKERDKYVKRLKQTKMASLIYLAAVKLDELPDALETLDSVTLQVQHSPYLQDRQHTLCGEELLHILYKGDGLSDSQNCRFSCFVSRMMCVARVLPEDEWEASFGILSHFLGIPYYKSSLPELLNRWGRVLSRRTA